MVQAVLSIFNDVDPGIEDRYELWYQTDHFPDRLNVPGFRRGRRYRRLRGTGREYFTFHEVDSLDVLTSPAYLTRLREPTPETTHLMPHFRRPVRSVCSIEVDRGQGIGGTVGALILAAPPADRLAAWRDAATVMFEELLAKPGITRARLWRTDPRSTHVDNPESRLRPEASEAAGAIVLIEGTLPHRIAEALALVSARDPFRNAAPPSDPPLYSLLFASVG